MISPYPYEGLAYQQEESRYMLPYLYYLSNQLHKVTVDNHRAGGLVWLISSG